MQRTSFRDMGCSLARSLDIAGEWWTPLVLRDIWTGRTRFDEIQQNLEISRKLLTERLDTLVSEEVLTREPYQDRPRRYEYLLTPKGEELMAVLLALLSWGDRWTVTNDGPPVHLRHRACGELAEAEVHCSACGELLRATEIQLEPGPGLSDGWGTRALPERHPLHAASVEALKGRRSRKAGRKPARSAR